MTTTTIYRLGTNPGEIGECKNSWRGAMYVWNNIARRYFCLESFPLFHESLHKRIFNAWMDSAMPLHEKVVLLCTMDKATVRSEDVQFVADAFKRYGAEHPNSSFSEQAAILLGATFHPGDLIAWRNTSTIEFWGEQYDEEDEVTYYDPSTQKLHFDAYAQALGAPVSISKETKHMTENKEEIEPVGADEFAETIGLMLKGELGDRYAQLHQWEIAGGADIVEAQVRLARAILADREARDALIFAEARASDTADEVQIARRTLRELQQAQLDHICDAIAASIAESRGG